MSDRFRLLPTRQPVVLDFWETARPARGPYRTVASWRQHGREFGLGGQWYEWSKHYEFEKVLELPARSGLDLELALANYATEDRARLEAHGWMVRDAGSGPAPTRTAPSSRARAAS